MDTIIKLKSENKKKNLEQKYLDPQTKNNYNKLNSQPLLCNN